MKNKILAIITGILIVSFFVSSWGRTAVQTVAGLAVAQSANLWNNIKDAAYGDNATNGVMAVLPYVYDGTNFDRVRGDITNGLDVDVTRVSGNVSVIGTTTPANSFTNPTTAVNTWSLLGGFNGTTWDRISTGGNSSDAEATRTTGLIEVDAYLRGFNGTTFDRIRSDANVYALYLAGQSNATSNITANATTTVKGTAGILNKVIINTAGTASKVAFYNVASASCTGTPATGYAFTIDTSTLGIIDIDHTFTSGICAVTTGTSAANISVLYR